jgi:hypothetical protein
MTLIAPNQNNPIHLQSNFGMGSDFGHADYVQAVNAGATLAEIRDWATRNPNQFINENAVGAGGLYDKIMSSSTPRGARPGIDNNPSNTAAGNWIGNSNTFDPNAKNYSIHRDIDVPQEPVPKEPIAGVDYPTGPVNDAIKRIRAHNQATHDFTAGAEPNMIQGMEGFVKQSPNPSTDFNAADWIAKTSRPDTDQQDHAQRFVDEWTFDIAKNLQPDPQSVVNALTTAIPYKLGVYS